MDNSNNPTNYYYKGETTMNILKKTQDNSIIRVIEINSEEFNNIFDNSNTILQVTELSNIPRTIIVEYIEMKSYKINNKDDEVLYVTK